MSDTQCLLTIAGTDPSGGAGIQVDLQVFRDWGFHGLSVITAIVCQNTAGVRRFEALSARLVRDEFETLLDDISPAGVKIGMVSRGEVVDQIAMSLEALRERGECPVVFDPVMASSAEQQLQRPGTVEAMREALIPMVDVLTPNVSEAEALLGAEITSRADFEAAARELLGLGCKAVLLKAGHLDAAADGISDVLATEEGVVSLRPLAPVDAETRGTGCQLSSALVAALAAGAPIREACEQARSYLNRLLHEHRRSIGAGRDVIIRAEQSFLREEPLDE